MNNINYNNLNKMILYIENNLENEIDKKKLATITGISINTLQRIFVFISGITLSEYIKKRRLSKAFEEIKSTNSKIIDIALKYQYNSVIAFDRAFKQTFGITPIECREKNIPYKQFPIMKFKDELNYELLNYEIRYLEETEIFYYKTETNKYIDLLYKIRELYNYLKEEGIHKKFKQEEQFAISSYENETYCYRVGSKTRYTSKEIFKIPAGNYAIFEVGTREQKDIVNIEKEIYSKWLPSTNLKLNENFSLEYYKGNNCYLCMPIIN